MRQMYRGTHRISGRYLDLVLSSALSGNRYRSMYPHDCRWDHSISRFADIHTVAPFINRYFRRYRYNADGDKRIEDDLEVVI